MNRIFLAPALALAGLLAGLGSSGPAAAAPIDRKLEISVTLDGKQDWRNALQWSKSTTTQRYEFTTGLRSDGKLEGANLLDMEIERRLAIKTEYLRRKGVARLKAEGIDPASPDLQKQISDRMQQDSFKCKGDNVCMSETSGKYAELMAAAMEPDNSEIFEGEPRYLFFFGYPGCPNRIHAVNKTHTEGETAYGRNKDHIFPYLLDLNGDSTGSARDQVSMCSYFTVVIDTKDQKMYVENVYLPAAFGRSVRTEFEKTQTQDVDLPIAAPLQGWINQVLRVAPLSGTVDATLPLTLPLDGNSTVLGEFTGTGKATLKWAWTGGPAGKP